MTAVLLEDASTRLADIAPAMQDSVAGTQACFRALLQAMSRPGLVIDLPSVSLRGLGTPRAADGAALGPGMAAMLLSLVDAETSVHWHGRLASAATQHWLRFHTGARAAGSVDLAEFVIARAEELDEACWRRLALGDDERPQLGSTLIVEVPALQAAMPGNHGNGTRLVLRGPGIADTHRLDVHGLAAPFWRYRQALQAQFPCGFDLVLVSGQQMAAVPRSTRISWDA